MSNIPQAVTPMDCPDTCMDVVQEIVLKDVGVVPAMKDVVQETEMKDVRVQEAQLTTNHAGSVNRNESVGIDLPGTAVRHVQDSEMMAGVQQETDIADVSAAVEIVSVPEALNAPSTDQIKPKPIMALTGKAPVNIAVIKYWGKRNKDLILPYNDSISGTLSMSELCTVTTVAASETFEKNRFWLNGSL